MSSSSGSISSVFGGPPVVSVCDFEIALATSSSANCAVFAGGQPTNELERVRTDISSLNGWRLDVNSRRAERNRRAIEESAVLPVRRHQN